MGNTEAIFYDYDPYNPFAMPQGSFHYGQGYYVPFYFPPYAMSPPPLPPLPLQGACPVELKMPDASAGDEDDSSSDDDSDDDDGSDDGDENACVHSSFWLFSIHTLPIHFSYMN